MAGSGLQTAREDFLLDAKTIVSVAGRNGFIVENTLRFTITMEATFTKNDTFTTVVKVSVLVILRGCYPILSADIIGILAHRRMGWHIRSNNGKRLRRNAN